MMEKKTYFVTHLILRISNILNPANIHSLINIKYTISAKSNLFFFLILNNHHHHNDDVDDGDYDLPSVISMRKHAMKTISIDNQILASR